MVPNDKPYWKEIPQEKEEIALGST